MSPLRAVGIALAGTLGASLAACGSSSGAAPGCVLVAEPWGPLGATPIRVERVATGLEVPWGLAFLPGGDVLVTERAGRIRIIRGGQLDAAPVATVPVAGGAESGLLGVAADPAFAENRRFYVHYTGQGPVGPVNRVVRWVLAEDRRSASADKVLLDGVAAAQFHDGGRVRFGPDGMLHVGTGDAGSAPRSQDLSDPAGKILRITPDGAPAPGNPFADSPVLVLGVRNVQAFDWLDDGTLVVADHGPSGELGRSGHDEVSLAHPGANLGWPEVYACERKDGMVSPILVSRVAMPPGGGSVYRGGAIPGWKGSFLVGTLGSRHLHRVELGPAGTLARHEVYLPGDPPAGLGRIRDVQEGPDGALWVTTSNCDGRGTCPDEKDVVARIVSP